MAKLILYLLFSILLVINVNKCRGKPSEQCEESDYPVCATNGTNLYFFKNICRLKSENKNREDHGLIKLNTIDISNCFKHCNQVCSDEFAPICATCEDDKKTFLNRCEFDLENCRYGNNWKFLHEGECPSTVPLLNHQSNVYSLQSDTHPNSHHHSYPYSDTKSYHSHTLSNPQSNEYPNQQPHVQLHPHPNSQLYLHNKSHSQPHELAHSLPPVQTLPSLELNQSQIPMTHVQLYPHTPQISQPHDDPHFNFQEQAHPQPVVQIPQNQTNEHSIPQPNILLHPQQQHSHPLEQAHPQPPVQILAIPELNIISIPKPHSELQSPPTSQQHSHPHDKSNPRIEPVHRPHDNPIQQNPQHVQPHPNPHSQQYPKPHEQPHPQPQEQLIPKPLSTVSKPHNKSHPSPNTQQHSHPKANPIPHFHAKPHSQYQDQAQTQPHARLSSQPKIHQFPQPHGHQIQRNHQSHSRPHPHTNDKPLSHLLAQNHPQTQLQSLPLAQPNKYLLPQPQVQPSQIPYIQDHPHPQQQTSPPRLPATISSHEEPVPIPFIINRRCPTHCSVEYDPICATFGGVDQTFDNQCYMRADICGSKRAWVVIHQGECTESESELCNSDCPRIYSPVCATLNGQNKTFANECVLESEICITRNPWDFLHTGECRNPNQNNCPTICPNVFIPVCATFNGIQRGFPNQCYVFIEACKSRQDWKIVHEGQCKRSHEPTTSLCSGPGQCNTQSPNAQPQPPYNPPIFTHPPLTQPTFVQPPLAQIQPSPSEQPTASSVSTMGCPDCSDAYNPVCGFLNGQQQTFNNECLLLSENCYSNTKWIVGHEGKCHAVETPRNCPNICPLNYDPVCATLNGVRRTFPNECELNHEAYKTNNQWVILSVGECDYCPVCPDDIAPVCAEFNGQSLTFDNVCKVEAENCRTNSAWKIVSKNSCEITNCPTYCPRIYIPICAISNGEARTFGNVCEMKHEACSTHTAWHIASKGECPGPNDNCPKSCSLQYNPVCAVHQGVLKEFINECFMRSEICKSHIDWEFVNAGPCANHNHRPTEVSIPEPITPTPIAELEPDCHVSKCLNFRDPVCATLNGEEKTFSNACYLHNLKCKTGEDWKIIKHDSCRNTSARRRRFPSKHVQ